MQNVRLTAHRIIREFMTQAQKENIQRRKQTMYICITVVAFSECGHMHFFFLSLDSVLSETDELGTQVGSDWSGFL